MFTENPKPYRLRIRRRKGERKGRGTLSKMVNDRIKDAGALCGAIEALKIGVAADLEQRYSPGLREGETAPDHALTLDLVGRSLEAALERLTEIDDHCAREVSEHRYQRRECEKVARKKVHPRAVKVRRMIDSTFGKEAGSRVHGLEGKTLRKPGRQRAQIRGMVQRLRDDSRELPPTLMKGAAVDRAVWLREVEPPYLELEALLKELQRQEPLAEAARAERMEVMKTFDAEYAEALRYVEAVFHMAGYSKQLTRKLRPVYKRRQLSRQARRKRESRAEERRRPKKSIRSRFSAISGWLGRRSA